MPETEAIPFVHYYCTCPDLGSSELRRPNDTKTIDERHQQAHKGAIPEDNHVAAINERHILTAKAATYLYPLSRLYFCEDCHQIRCPSCVQDEIVSYYCPNCLFEVPTASVKSEKNRCARNCFQCPVCQNTLSVVAAQEPPPTTPLASATTASAAGPYFLACNVCRWNSQEVDMTFEKPTSLALQLQKSEDALPDAREFDNLKDHFEKHLRVNAPPSLSTSFLSFSGSGFSKALGSQYHSDQSQSKLDDIAPYEPCAQPSNDEAHTIDTLSNLRSVDKVSNLSQRYTQLNEQPYDLGKIHPQRIHLCIKRSKRCRTCRHILIKPEQKAQATRFKIKLVAMNYIPNISIIKLPRARPLEIGLPNKFVLKFTNPLYEEMSVTLATPQTRRKPGEATVQEEANSKFNGKVTILSPHFKVGAYNETIEYDDEMYPAGNAHGRGTGNSAGLESSWVDGVYEKRKNYTSVIVEVIPEKAGEFKFPLLVTYNYKSEEDRMDVSSGDIDEDDIEEMDRDSSVDGSKKAGSTMRPDDDRIKSYSFWCLVGLGNVEDNSVTRRAMT